MQTIFDDANFDAFTQLSSSVKNQEINHCVFILDAKGTQYR